MVFIVSQKYKFYKNGPQKTKPEPIPVHWTKLLKDFRHLVSTADFNLIFEMDQNCIVSFLLFYLF